MLVVGILVALLLSVISGVHALPVTVGSRIPPVARLHQQQNRHPQAIVLAAAEGESVGKTDETIAMQTPIKFAAAAVVVGLSLLWGHLFSGSGGGGGGVLLETVTDIPGTMFKEHAVLYGEVLKVTDGDTYKIRHIPGNGVGKSSSSSFKGSLKQHTLVVRIYGVDTPETAKFGQPGQQFGKEATDFAEDKLLNRVVSMTLLSRDRYGRAIAVVKYKDGGTESDISNELLKRGLAVVYRQGGAQYFGAKEQLNSLEDAARRGKKGIWSIDEGSRELPSEYKKKLNSKKSSASDKKKKEKVVSSRDSGTATGSRRSSRSTRSRV